MCIPAFSPVQYADFQLNGSGLLQGAHSVLSNMGHSKKIGNFYHFSRLGVGHSAATLYKARIADYLNEGSYWEGFWWNGRQPIIKDKPFNMPESEILDARNAAQQYYETCCIGNIKTFRRWLLGSIEKTDRPDRFINRLEGVFHKNQFGQMQTELRIHAPASTNERVLISSEEKAMAARVIGKYLRRRKNFRDHFADDSVLWLGTAS